MFRRETGHKCCSSSWKYLAKEESAAVCEGNKHRAPWRHCQKACGWRVVQRWWTKGWGTGLRLWLPGIPIVLCCVHLPYVVGFQCRMWSQQKLQNGVWCCALLSRLWARYHLLPCLLNTTARLSYMPLAHLVVCVALKPHMEGRI